MFSRDKSKLPPKVKYNTSASSQSVQTHSSTVRASIQKEKSNSIYFSVADVMALQHIIGNKALDNLVNEINLKNNTIPQSKLSVSSENLALQDVFNRASYNGKLFFIDIKTRDIYAYRFTYGDGSIILQNSKYAVRIDKGGKLLEKNPIPQIAEDDVMDETQSSSIEKIDTTKVEEGVLLSPPGSGTVGLADSDVSQTKLITSLSAQVALIPINQGNISTETSGLLEYKYNANQIWVKSIQVGDKDRPETRFENQESHTVSWTLVRNGLIGLANQSLYDFLQYMYQEFKEVEPLIDSSEGKMLTAAVSGLNILEIMQSRNLPLDIWQKLTSQLFVHYFQVYQLSNAATYKRGKALGHGEAHTMERLRADEEKVRQHISPRPAAKVALDIAKLLDVRFNVGALGVREYAFAIQHWIKMLQSSFPGLMLLYQEKILEPTLKKEVSKSFKDELGIDRAKKFSVSDLLTFYNSSPGVAKIQTYKELPQINLHQVNLETLTTNFVANISLSPHQQGIQQKRDINSQIHITDMAYPHSFLSISRVHISDNDRPKTKFIQNQKSHTVPWTLTRNSIISFEGKPLEFLLSYLLQEFQKLSSDIKVPEGLEVAKSGVKLIEENSVKSLPIDTWQEIISELVRRYAIAYQVAESTTYINPLEAERALGHGEASNMNVLDRNEYTINNFDSVLDNEISIVNAIKGMFDAKVNSTLSEKGVKTAFLGMCQKLEMRFPSVCRNYLDKAVSQMRMFKIGKDNRSLGAILDERSIGIDASGFEVLQSIDPFQVGNYIFNDNDLVDETGSIRPTHLNLFHQAYRMDIATSNSYLTEGEGNLAAQYLGIALQVFEGQLPPGYVRVENSGGGNCLLHALVQAHAKITNQAVLPTEATIPQIQQLRNYIATNIDAQIISNLVTAAVAGQVLGIPEPGLGINMRQLLAHPSLQAAHRLQATKVASIDKVKNNSSQQKSKGLTTQQIQLPRAVATLGAGTPSANVALLHVGVHYVMIYQN